LKADNGTNGYWTRVDDTLGEPAMEFRYESNAPNSTDGLNRNRMTSARAAKGAGSWLPSQGMTLVWAWRVRVGPNTRLGNSFLNAVSHTWFDAVQSGPTNWGKQNTGDGTPRGSTEFMYNRGARNGAMPFPADWMDYRFEVFVHPSSGTFRGWYRAAGTGAWIQSGVQRSGIDTAGTSNHQISMGPYSNPSFGRHNIDVMAFERFIIADGAAAMSEVDSFMGGAPTGGGGGLALPGVPTGLRVINDTGTTLTLEADVRPSAEQVDYYVWYFNGASGEGTTIEWSTVASAAVGGKVSFTFTQANSPLEPGQTFEARVSAHNATGHGNWSNPLSVTRTTTGLPAPTGLALVGVPHSGDPGPGVRLNWDALVLGTGDTYEVERDGVVVATGLTSPTVVDDDPEVRAGDTHIYRVRHGESPTFSPYSAPISVSPRPYPPTGLVATPVVGGVQLDWDANEDLRTPDRYQVYVDGAIVINNLVDPTYIVQVEGTHAFRVSAGSDGTPPTGGYGDWSAPVDATAIPSPITLSDTEVTLPTRHAGSTELAEVDVDVNGSGAFEVINDNPELTILIDGVEDDAGDAPATLTVQGDPSTMEPGSHQWTLAVNPAGAPINQVAPVATSDGTPAVGEVLSCSTGTWINTPTSYAYQWYRDGVAIGSATANSYTIVTADRGTELTCRVTATNAVGSSAPAESNGIDVPAATVTLSRYARNFPAGTSDKIVFPIGGSTGTEPMTWWVIARAGAQVARLYYLIGLHNNTEPGRALGRHGSTVQIEYHDHEFGGRWQPSPAQNRMMLVAGRRNTAGTLAISTHDFDESDPDARWIHGAEQSMSRGAADTTGFVIGGLTATGSATGWLGIILAGGFANAYYTTGQLEDLIEPAGHCKRSTWEAAPSIQHVWPLNQSSVATPVPDTVGTSDQSAITGTTIYDAGSAILPWEDA
jgi:hypothetical protein